MSSQTVKKQFSVYAHFCGVIQLENRYWGENILVLTITQKGGMQNHTRYVVCKGNDERN